MRVLSGVVVGIICLSCLGCQTQSDKDRLIAVEENDLGVTHVEFIHAQEATDHLLTIRGFDASGEEIALAKLRTGIVHYSSEPGALPEEPTPGRELKLSLGGDEIVFVNPGFEPREISIKFDDVADFVDLHLVAAAIDEEASIRFVRLKHSEEAFAGSATTCSTSLFSQSHPQCCQDGADAYNKVGSGANMGKLAFNKIGTACRTTNGSTNCGANVNNTNPPPPACDFGPCGLRNYATIGASTAKVFFPTFSGFETYCGYDADDGSLNFFPNTYSGETLYSGVTGSCAVASCGAGVAGHLLEVWTYDPQGTVTSSPSGISVSGGSPAVDVAVYTPNTAVTLTVVPQTNFRVSLSGPNCNITGNPSQTVVCNITMNSPKGYSVTFGYF